MYQQEIEYFFPLTEQIALDLDYRECRTKQLYTPSNNVQCEGFVPLGVINSSMTTTYFTLQENATTMIVLKKPNIIRKWLFKILGIKWEVAC